MKILTVDDHALVREGLRQVLKGLDEGVVVLDASTCEHAFEVADHHPDLDLVLLDYHLPDMDGLAALAVFGQRHPELPIIVLSGSANVATMRKVLTRGAAGFITKSSLSHELLKALRMVMAGGVYMPPELDAPTGPVPGRGVTGRVDPPFTVRQEQVLQLLMDGCSNKEICRLLGLSDDTVKQHVTTILRGFGVQNRTQAVVAASRFGYAMQPLP